MNFARDFVKTKQKNILVNYDIFTFETTPEGKKVILGCYA